MELISFTEEKINGCENNSLVVASDDQFKSKQTARNHHSNNNLTLISSNDSDRIENNIFELRYGLISFQL
jgi:hypothetical protein